MTHPIIRARIAEAALALSTVDDGTPTVRIGSLVPWWAYRTPLGVRPSVSQVSLLVEVAQSIGLMSPRNSVGAHAMLPMHEVPATVTALDALSYRILNPNRIAALWQLGAATERGSDRVRAALVAVPDMDEHSEALVGLLAHGITAAEVPAMLAKLKGRNAPIRWLAAANLAQVGFSAAADSPEIDALVRSAHDAGAVEQVLAAIHGDESAIERGLASSLWTERLGVAYLMGALAGREGVSPEWLLFTACEHLRVEKDDDVTIALGWVLARCAARWDDAESCSFVLCDLFLNSPGSVTRQAVVLAAGALGDAEGVRKILREARVVKGDEALERCVHWTECRLKAEHPGFELALADGALAAVLVNPWSFDDPFVERVRRLDPVADAPRLSLALRRASSLDAARATLIGWLIADDPSRARWFDDPVAPPVESTWAARCAAFLDPTAANVDPVLVRVFVGAEFGGPLRDEPEVWGRLLRAMLEPAFDGAARDLLRMCPMGVQVARAWHAANLHLPERSAALRRESWRARMFGFVGGWREAPPERAPIARLHDAALPPKGVVIEAFASLPAEVRVDLLRTLAFNAGSIVTRRFYASLASDLGISPKSIEPLFWRFRSSPSWENREIAALLARFMTEIDAERASVLADSLLILAHDSDSDVRGAARGSADVLVLSLEVA